MEFNERLRALRKERKLTQTAMGEILGYGYTAISNYESGRNEPSISDLKKISKYFQVSLDYLVGLTDTRQAFPDSQADSKTELFWTRYAQLNAESRQELDMLMQWLLFKQTSVVSTAKDLPGGFTPIRVDENPATVLKVAQNDADYDIGKKKD